MELAEEYNDVGTPFGANADAVCAKAEQHTGTAFIRMDVLLSLSRPFLVLALNIEPG